MMMNPSPPTHEERCAQAVATGRALTVSVVLCAFSSARWQSLLEAVSSVGIQSPKADEVVVVIDHNAELLERARRELPCAVVIPNRERRGLSGARNTGVQHARSDVVAFLDDDARAQLGWLAAVVAAYSNPRVIGTTGPAEALWTAARPSWFPEEFGWVVGCSYRGLPTSTAEVRNPIGANMSFRRRLFDIVGGFADGIGRVGSSTGGCEETEFAIRARRVTAGAILHLADARVEHRVPGDRASWRYFRSRCWSEGRSKAQVAASVGSGRALASERTYVTRTLPTGVARGVRDAARGDASGLLRAVAIVAGLAITTAGYGCARVARKATRGPGSAELRA
ncbi:MAG: hypothetical protein QOE87_1548 [Gaiellales bacterium]|jgi:GT2 family glycosyltransferase|nr:hypothetical protein [Gaiellales bacterium]